MKKNEDAFTHFREALNDMEGNFHILEQRVPVELQMEYFKYSEQLRKTTPDPGEAGLERHKDTLHSPESSTEEKRHALAGLAVSKDVKAYRLLEEYVGDPDPEMTHWAYLALMESRMSLESELLDRQQVYISTGLGGKGDKLRFYALFFSDENKPFEAYQRQVIEREFAYCLRQDGCPVERLTIHDTYVELVFLISVHLDLKSILEHLINECNEYGDFLSTGFTITNVKELSSEEIAALIQKKSNRES
jgi:hypothetical protein